MPSRFKKLGFMDYSEEGALLLVNPKGEAVIVDDAVLSLWHMADGKTMREVYRFIEARRESRARETSIQTRRLVRALKKLGLLEGGR